jgi:hypothetical protein
MKDDLEFLIHNDHRRGAVRHRFRYEVVVIDVLVAGRFFCGMRTLKAQLRANSTST